MDIRQALGYVMVMDVEDEAWDYRYRVYGTLIAERSGFDATGKLISELALHPMEPFFISSYNAAPSGVGNFCRTLGTIQSLTLNSLDFSIFACSCRTKNSQ